MIIELIIGSIVIGGFFFWLQHRMSRKVDKIIQEKAKAEKEKKAFECQRIIDDLQGLHKMETDFMELLKNYQGVQSNEGLISFAKLTIIPISQSIGRMKDAMSQLQLQGLLTANTLRGDFLEFVGWSNFSCPNREKTQLCSALT